MEARHGSIGPGMKGAGLLASFLIAFEGSTANTS